MLFISKLAYYATFTLASLFSLYLLLSPVNNLMYHPFVKRSENIIFVIGAAVAITGLIFARNTTRNGEQYLLGVGMLLGSCVLSFIIIMIGLLFFNGPLKWN